MNAINNFLLKIENWSLWKEYKRRAIKRNKINDFVRGCGYYFFVGGPNKSILEWNSKVAMKMKSGKIGYFQLIDFKLFSDPIDMIEYSIWQFLGYQGSKLIHECSFKEFIDIYGKSFAK